MRIWSIFSFFLTLSFTSSGSFTLFHSVFLFCSLFTCTVFHKVRCGVYPASASPRSVSLHRHHPFLVTPSHLLPLSSFFLSFTSFVPQLFPINLGLRRPLLLLLSTLSFSIPGAAFFSHPLIHTFFALHPSPRLSSSITLAFPGCLIISFLHPSSTVPLRFIFLFTDEWWEIWKCQRDQAGDQRRLC